MTEKIIAPKVGGAKLAKSSMLAEDGQLASSPSVLFDAIVVLLSYEGADIDFVRDIFGFLKANVVDESTMPYYEQPIFHRCRRDRCQRYECNYQRSKNSPKELGKVGSNISLMAIFFTNPNESRKERIKCIDQ